MITIHDVKRGYEDSAIQLIKSPHGERTVCRIGEYWFYFGGTTADDYSPKKYKKYVPEEDIIKEIYDTLDEMGTEREDFGDEYDYYEGYLKEVVDAKVRVRTYNRTGDIDQNYFFNDIRNAVRKYVEIRNNTPDYKYCMSSWPTIWVRTGQGFRRVHDFTYVELSDETFAKYLAERIIDGDELLETVV